MKGSVKAYFAEKGFGFIQAEDGQDYFFHKTAFDDKTQVYKLCEELEVEFDPEETGKGLQAQNCELLDTREVVTYVEPEDLITSRSNGVKGWMILEAGSWMVHGSSLESSDEAKIDLVEKGAQVGANTLINVEYYQTKGFSDAGMPFSVTHHFKGRPVILGKKNAKATLKREDLIGLNEKATQLKTKLQKLTKASKLKRNLIWLTTIGLSVGAWFIQPWLILPIILVGAFVGRSKKYDAWLEKT